MQMPDAGFPVEVIRSVPVVAAPEDIDITNAAELRTALGQAAARGHGTFVVDMSRTQFCDTAGLHALVGAHKRARAEGGQVLLVVVGDTVLRIFSITGLDRVIPYFSSLEQALAQTPAAHQDRE
jgi:anti-sigma B factor antagonist